MTIASEQGYFMAHSKGGDPDVIKRDHRALLFQVLVNFSVADSCAFIHANDQATLAQVTNLKPFLFGIIALAKTAIKLAEHRYRHPDFLSLIKCSKASFWPRNKLITALVSTARLPTFMDGFDSLTALVDCVLKSVDFVRVQASRQVIEAAFGHFGKTVDIMSNFLDLVGRQGFQLFNGFFQCVHSGANIVQLHKKCNLHSLSLRDEVRPPTS
jgi:hypothetical protein